MQLESILSVEKGRIDASMKKLTILITAVTLCISGFGQKLKFLEMNPEAFHHANVRGFQYLHENLNEAYYNWIGDVKVELDTILPGVIKEAYHQVAQKANRLAANAFRVVDADIYSYGDKKHITFRLYYLNRENFRENQKEFKSTSVYIFGFLSYHEKIKGYKIMINGQKYLVEELQYQVLDLPTDEVLTVKLYNGFGSTVKSFKGNGNTRANYLTFNLIQRTLTKGEIREHPWSFAEFLIRVLDQDKHELSITY